MLLVRFVTEKQNVHPTVKPIELMSYLITLGSRENDVVVDPFVGSGTTCIAAKCLIENISELKKKKIMLSLLKQELKMQNHQINLPKKIKAKRVLCFLGGF